LSYVYFDRDGAYLDFAGGYGLLSRRMRDIGFDFYWHDVFTKNILSNGFEHKEGKQYELITAFEAFEHFENPIMEIETMLGFSRNILFSTLLHPQPIPKPEQWWYYGLEFGQHISFYSLKTLQYVADKYKLKICSNGVDFHLLTTKTIDPFVFKLLVWLTRRGFASFIPKMMESKTQNDMQMMIDKKKILLSKE